MTRQELIDKINWLAKAYPKDIEVAAFKRSMLDLINTSLPENWDNVLLPVEVDAHPPSGASQVCITDDGYTTFFDAARAGTPLGPSLNQDEVDGCNYIIDECSRVKWPVAWTAYALATAYHETAGTMRPIKEYGRGAGKPYGRPGKYKQVPYGRGYVQLTWDYNYESMDKNLGLKGSLLANFDRALEPELAAKIMIYGMEFGTFTGKSLELYLPTTADIIQFTNARRVINSLDKAELIAGYAISFQKYLMPAWSC